VTVHFLELKVQREKRIKKRVNAAKAKVLSENNYDEYAFSIKPPPEIFLNQFQSNPDAALALFHHNTGHHFTSQIHKIQQEEMIELLPDEPGEDFQDCSVEDYNNLRDNFNVDAKISNIALTQIDEFLDTRIVTDAIKSETIAAYQNEMNPTQLIEHGCACCGERYLGQKCKQKSLDELKILKLNEDKLQIFHQHKENAQLYEMPMNVVECINDDDGTSTVYHLHPSLVIPSHYDSDAFVIGDENINIQQEPITTVMKTMENATILTKCHDKFVIQYNKLDNTIATIFATQNQLIDWGNSPPFTDRIPRNDITVLVNEDVGDMVHNGIINKILTNVRNIESYPLRYKKLYIITVPDSDKEIIIDEESLLISNDRRNFANQVITKYLICENCDKCIITNELPEYSLANNYDFGNLFSVFPMYKNFSQLFITALSPVRLFNEILSVKSKMKQDAHFISTGNMICFEQDGVEKIKTDIMPRQDLKQTISVLLLGPSNAKEQIKKLHPLYDNVNRQINIDEMFHTLLILAHVNNRIYSDYSLLEDTELLKTNCEKTIDVIQSLFHDENIHDTDTESIHKIYRFNNSDVDVAKIRTNENEFEVTEKAQINPIMLSSRQIANTKTSAQSSLLSALQHTMITTKPELGILAQQQQQQQQQIQKQKVQMRYTATDAIPNLIPIHSKIEYGNEIYTIFHVTVIEKKGWSYQFCEIQEQINDFIILGIEDNRRNLSTDSLIIKDKVKKNILINFVDEYIIKVDNTIFRDCKIKTIITTTTSKGEKNEDLFILLYNDETENIIVSESFLIFCNINASNKLIQLENVTDYKNIPHLFEVGIEIFYNHENWNITSVVYDDECLQWQYSLDGIEPLKNTTTTTTTITLIETETKMLRPKITKRITDNKTSLLKEKQIVKQSLHIFEAELLKEESNRKELKILSTLLPLNSIVFPHKFCIDNSKCYIITINNIVYDDALLVKEFCTTTLNSIHNEMLYLISYNHGTYTIILSLSQLIYFYIDEYNKKIETNILNNAVHDTYVDVLQIQRQNAPINEFESNDKLFLSAFPFLFLLGEGWKGKGSASKSFLKHLFYQFDGRFAKNYKILFSLANQVQRHKLLRNVNVKMSNPNNEDIQEVMKLVNDENILSKLKECEEHPQSEISKKIFKNLNNVLSLTAQTIPYSPQERSGELSKLYALTSMFGCATLFVTIAVSDVHDCLTIRLNHIEKFNNNDKGGFEFIQEIRTNDSNYNLYKDAIENPVHCTIVFHKMMHSFFTFLIKKNDEKHGKIEKPISVETDLGIYALILAFLFVIECSGRKSLHSHGLFFGAVPPFLLSVISEYPILCDKVANVIDSMICAEISPSSRIALNTQTLQVQNKKCPRKHLSLFQLPTPEEDSEYYNLNVGVIAGSFCQHSKHTPSCVEGKHGKYCCRYCYPRGLVPKRTGPTEIEEVIIDKVVKENEKSNEDVINTKNDKINTVSTVVKECVDENNRRLPISKRVVFNDWGSIEQPMPKQDDRLILFEITRYYFFSLIAIYLSTTDYI